MYHMKLVIIYESYYVFMSIHVFFLYDSFWVVAFTRQLIKSRSCTVQLAFEWCFSKNLHAPVN